MDNASIIARPAQQMTNQQRERCALQVLNNKATVTEIAERYQVSRQFISSQKSKAVSAIEKEFSDVATGKEKTLCHLPVTKSWIEQFTLCLMLHGRTPFRGIQQIIHDVLDYEISPASVHNISVTAKHCAAQINATQDLSSVTLSAHDEIFHLNKPVLVGVDIPSLYCYLLSQEDQRDSETWAIHFMDLQRQGA